MKFCSKVPVARTGTALPPEADPVEQWVRQHLALAPALSPEQLGRLRMLLAAPPTVELRAS
jgi:hypothetical protein